MFHFLFGSCNFFNFMEISVRKKTDLIQKVNRALHHTRFECSDWTMFFCLCRSHTGRICFASGVNQMINTSRSSIAVQLFEKR